MHVLPSLSIEKKLWKKGYKFVCGVDEVGRGCFAGPVVVGAVVFSPDISVPEGLADSKLLTANQRERLEKEIKKQALAWAVAEISVSKINKAGVGKATQMGFRKAVKLLNKRADYVLIDAFYIGHFNRKKQQAVKGGDKLSSSIAAASIIAKVYRDRLMKQLHKKYPVYGFVKHKGYGTKLHQEAIKAYGLTRIHRKSFNLEKFLAHVG